MPFISVRRKATRSHGSRQARKVYYRRRKVAARAKARVRGGLAISRRAPPRGFISTRAVFPDQTSVKLTYIERYEIGASANSTLIYRGTSPYDPVYATGGSQPFGYDQYALLYKQYRCSGSSIEVEFHTPPTATPGLACFVSLLPWPDDSTPSYSYGGLLTQPNVRRVITKTDGTISRVKNYMSTSKLFGAKTSIINDRVSVTADPALNPWNWHINVQPVDLSTTLSGARYLTRITYYVTFFERRNTPDA